MATYISGSAKRTAILQEIQDYFGEQKKKILKLADTRWLALHQCVVRMLDCWNSLSHYFLLAVSEDHLKSAEVILESLNNNVVKAYFYFLKYSLNLFNSFNAMFQTKSIIIHEMYSNSIRLLKMISQNFIKPEYLMTDKLDQLSFTDPKNYLRESEIFVGSECEEFIKTFPKPIFTDFKNTCLKFYVKAAQEIAVRLPINNQLFQEFQFLDPNICLNPKNYNKSNQLDNSKEIFGSYIDKYKVVEELREIPYFFNNEQIENFKKMSITEMWHEISTVKDFTSDNYKFNNICILAKMILTLPHSNASAERIFSIVTDVKTKKRNRIGDNTLNSVAIIRSSFQDKNLTANKFIVTDEHLKLHNYNMYKTETKK